MRINKSLWFVVILVAILGMVIIDGSSILFTKWQLSDQADGAVSDTADVAANSNSSEEALKEVAQASLNDRMEGATVRKVEIDDDNGTVTIVVTKTASTFFVKHISALRGLTELRVESTWKTPAG